MVKPGYKQTEVGVIPEDWECDTLEDFIMITHGFAFQSQYFDSYSPYILMTPGHFYESGGFRDVGEKQKYYRGPIPNGSVLQAGDLILAMTEQADGLLGSAAIVPEVGCYLHNQRLGRVKLISPSIDIGFLYYLFNSSGYRAGVRETAAGTKVKHTSPKKLLEIKVPLPPLPEQRTIAEALADVDGLLAGLDKLIAKKQAIKTATMQHLLTGKTRLPGFGGAWTTVTIGEMFEVTAGKDLVKSEYSETNDGKHLYPIYANSIFNRGVYGYCSFNEYEGDCITVTARGTLGVAFYRPKPFVAIGRLLVLKPKKLLNSFFVSELINHQLEFSSESTGVPQLTAPQISKCEISIPSLGEQRAIAQILIDMDAEITALETRRAKTEAIKQGMMQELLSGRTRLR